MSCNPPSHLCCLYTDSSLHTPPSFRSSHSGVTSSQSLRLSSISDVTQIDQPITATTQDRYSTDTFMSAQNQLPAMRNGICSNPTVENPANNFWPKTGHRATAGHCSGRNWLNQNGRTSHDGRAVNWNSPKEKVTLLTSL